jgi:hypothetical protein
MAMRPFRAANQGEVDAYYRRNNRRSGYTGYSPTQTDHALTRIRANDAYLSTAALHPDKPVNPKFHPAITSHGNVGGGLPSGLIRGRMTQIAREPAKFPDARNTHRRAVQFLYNPQAIAMNYSFETTALPPEAQDPTSAATPSYAASGQSLSWRLYFNRMYEVAEDPENMGVLADVQALEYLVGTYSGLGMAAMEVLVVFGNTPRLRPFAFVGHIVNLDVQYLNFSYRMIPTTAMVDVSLARRFVGQDIAGQVAASLANPTTPVSPGMAAGDESQTAKTPTDPRAPLPGTRNVPIGP